MRQVLALVCLCTAGVLPAQAPPDRAWTLDEAWAELRANPGDPYLQYVTLQLARRADGFRTWSERVKRLSGRGGRDRGRAANLFDLFTGAAAVQESLQLDTLLSGRAEPPAAQTIEVATLTGPTVRSHPWKELLAGRKPELSALSRMVPHDQWFVEFRSLTKMLQLMESGDLWGSHFFHQAAKSATAADVGERLRTQLAVETNPLLRPFYDLAVKSVGLTGSDLYLREGSDVTLIFEIRQPALFRARMDSFLARAIEVPGAKEEAGTLLGVPYRHVRTPDRRLHVWSAYPEERLHVRSNSRVALRRVLAAIAGRDRRGRKPTTLADTLEFAYIRTLMPYGTAEEDGLVYLSDPFVRRLVGPALKLKERRRMLCFNNLRMVGHAGLLHLTQRGTKAASLPALAKAGCLPAGGDALPCPDGGAYRLEADGVTATCERHGHVRSLTPCCELPLMHVTPHEAREYERFREEYSRYWRRYFDPIALRLRTTPVKHRVETIVLPLIDNTLYTRLSQTMRGPTAALDDLPVPEKNIFTVSFALDRRMLGDALHDFVPRGGGRRSGAELFTEEELGKLIGSLGNPIGLHVYDTKPVFDLSLPRLLGMALDMNTGSRMGEEFLWWGFFGASITAPVYLSIPVENPKVVDAFLEKIDPWLAAKAREPSSGWFFATDYDFYRLGGEEGPSVRGASIGFGPAKFRLFWTRLGDALYVASKKEILADLARAPRGKGPTGHGMLRIRAHHWKDVVPDYQLGWAEGNRQACLANLSPLSDVARAATDPSQLGVLAARLYGIRHFCPDGGTYAATEDGKHVACTVHGTTSAPRRPAAPADRSDLGRLLQQFRQMTATLTFLPEGLRAVVEIERRATGEKGDDDPARAPRAPGPR